MERINERGNVGEDGLGGMYMDEGRERSGEDGGDQPAEQAFTDRAGLHRRAPKLG